MLTHYLDDWWLTQKLLKDLKKFARVFLYIVEEDIGFPISHNKTVGPAQQLDFVGLRADLVRLTITLPQEKITKCMAWINKLIKAYNMHSFVTVKDLERCAGTLNFACQALPVGRPFLHSIYTLQWVRDHKTDRTVSQLVKQDLEMFKTFFTDNNYFTSSVPFLRRLGLQSSALEIMADAAGNPNLGFGCYASNGEWCAYSWKDTNWFQPESATGTTLKARDVIFQLELFAIISAFRLFGKHTPGMVVLLRSDNMSTVHAINSMTSDLEAPMQLLRQLALTCMSFQILVKATHIRGKDNRESDKLSRAKIQEFLQDHPDSIQKRRYLPTSQWPPSWKPSMQRKSSGLTSFRRM